MWLAVWLGCAGEDKPVVVDQDRDGAVAEADCDDTDNTIHPGAEEVPYDGVDQDCADGDLVDADGDGVRFRDDCDDADPERYPGNEDVPYDGIDQDCEHGDNKDADEDGYKLGEDCADEDPWVHPNAIDDVGDGIDNNCDGVDGFDGDQDTWASAESGGLDCNDEDTLTNPAAEEIWYDDIDEDCDNGCDFDQDGDGTLHPDAVVVPGGPCDLVPLLTDCDDTDSLATTTRMMSLSPFDGTIDVDLGATVTATLSLAEPGSSISIADAAGTPIAGTSSVVGTTITFTPDAPLPETSTLTVTVDWTCGPRDTTFTTVTTVDPATLFDRVWDIDVAAGTFTAPAGITPIVAPNLTTALQMTVFDGPGDELDVRVAQSTGGVQEMCTPTIDHLAVPYALDPRFELPPADYPFVVGGIDVTLNDAVFSGMFAADGSSIVYGELEGELDTRPLVPVVNGTADEHVCNLLGGRPPCQACSDGTGDYCVIVTVTDVPAQELVGGVVTPRTDVDIAADPSCVVVP